MLEYVFFDQRPLDRFQDFLREHGVAFEADRTDGAFDLESLEVRIPEGLDEALEEAIEARYDELMAWSQELVDDAGGEDADHYHAAGVVLNLQDGQTAYAHVDPHLLGRVMEVLTPEEFGRIVNAIVDAVERPDGRTFCQRMRDGSA